MKIEYSYGEGTRLSGERVVAIGFFDGVHIAHRELIYEAERMARELGVPYGILTFASSGDIKSTAGRIYNDEEKVEIFDSLGVDFTILCDFASVRGLSADEFINDVLIGELGCLGAVVGYNFRFGRGAVGTAEYLKASLISKGRGCAICEEVLAGDVSVSSSYIRELIMAGRITEANRLLGSPYFISGNVVHGDGRGRRLGYPTLNNDIGASRCIPRMGVYRSAVMCGGKLYPAITNIGTCPTFGKRACHAESYIIGESVNLYGEKTKLYLLEYMREERRFESAQELLAQIDADKNAAIIKNGEEKWQEYGLK